VFAFGDEVGSINDGRGIGRTMMSAKPSLEFVWCELGLFVDGMFDRCFEEFPGV
jgi:hypothetical protein